MMRNKPLLLLILLMAAGCTGPSSDCDTPLSDEPVLVTDAALPDLWIDNGSVTILLMEGDSLVSNHSLDTLAMILLEQAGVEVEAISRIQGDSDMGALTIDEVESLGFDAAAQNPSNEPLIVIVKVSETTDYPANGWISSRGDVAVICLEHKFMSQHILPEDTVEAMTLIHEFGHWLGVPARDYHTASDGKHCTDCRCVMQAGEEIDAQVILANLLTGPPIRFGAKCATELAEIRRRRELTGE